MKVIGLTGGIASGKSLVAGWLIEAGLPLIEADSVYKRLSAPGGSLYRALIGFLPVSCLTDDGSIAWKKLGELVFADQDFRYRLNQLTHPAVIKEIMIELDTLRKNSREMAVLSVPLLFESGSDKLCDLTICVYVDQETQLKRLMQRDNIDRKYASMKIASQMSLEEKRALADYVIDNSRGIDETKSQFETVLRAIRSV